mmetsp:Transcript_21385/g.52391  ORF Transcript_21385/g.52391 Transcript_21385/m.52391 type:complete len:455 (-) Transcript_21385:132-1496(-)
MTFVTVVCPLLLSLLLLLPSQGAFSTTRKERNQWLQNMIKDRGGDSKKLVKLDLNGRNLSSSDIPDLSVFPKLKAIEIRRNNITTFEFFRRGSGLKKLDISNNPVNSITKLSNLTQLQTLISSCCCIRDTVDLSFLPCLKSFIANSNNISRIRGFGFCPDLTTLILSRNNLSKLDFLRRGGEFLQKLSISHNHVSEISETDIGIHLVNLKELRMNDNKIRNLPKSISKLSCLSLLDLGRNNITSLDDILPLKTIMSLRNLNLLGNPITRTRGYPRSLIELLGNRLEILDNKRLRTNAHKKSSLQSAENLSAERKIRQKRWLHHPRSSEDGDSTEVDVDSIIRKALAPFGQLAAYNPIDAYASGDPNPDVSELQAALKEEQLSQSRKMLELGKDVKLKRDLKRNRDRETTETDEVGIEEAMKDEKTGIQEIKLFPNSRKSVIISKTLSKLPPEID